MRIEMKAAILVAYMRAVDIKILIVLINGGMPGITPRKNVLPFSPTHQVTGAQHIARKPIPREIVFTVVFEYIDIISTRIVSDRVINSGGCHAKCSRKNSD